MNDKELFWSLISPHLVDRPEASNRVSWGLTKSLEQIDWRHLKAFTMQNHIFVIPSNLVWRDDFIEESGYDRIPLSQYPEKMVIVSDKRHQKRLRVYFYIKNCTVDISLVQMHHSETEYAIGRTMIHKETHNFLPTYKKNSRVYAVYNKGFKFLNWMGDPFTVK